MISTKYIGRTGAIRDFHLTERSAQAFSQRD
jgi:hypothetical protein